MTNKELRRHLKVIHHMVEALDDRLKENSVEINTNALQNISEYIDSVVIRAEENHVVNTHHSE